MNDPIALLLFLTPLLLGLFGGTSADSQEEAETEPEPQDDEIAPISAIIGGITAGLVTEDTGGALSTRGTLTVTDPDPGEAEFVGQTGTIGTYGTFNLGPDGDWNYFADNSQNAIQALNTGENLTDRFAATTIDGTTQLVTITIAGQTDFVDAIIGGVTSGSVAEDAAVMLTLTDTLTVTDPNPDEAAFVAQSGTSGTYGAFDLTSDGTWTYTADNSQSAIQALDTGDSLTDSFTAVTVDGTTQAVDITINGLDDPVAAVIGGTTAGAVTEDDGSALTASGALTVTDPNTGEAVFMAQSATAGTYGTFDLATDGTWSYAADNTQVAIQRLNTGETLTDSFTAATADGTTQTVTITIEGLDDPIAAIELSAVESDANDSGFVINGVSASDRSGISVSGAGDVNGDGLDDLIVGAGGDDPNGSGSGASFVVFGKAAGTTVELSAVEAGTGGFVINGVSVFDGSGFSVSGAGDVNGDGLDDLIVGAYADAPNGSYSGASFVVFGKADGTAVELSAVEAGTGGFVINGVSASDYAGVSVSGAGDVNGDGLDDLIVGAYRDDPNGASSGASFVVYGKADGTAVELSAVEAGTGGFVINGVSSGDQLGVSVSGAGDVNGDGLDDLIVGARYDDPNGSVSGASFVVFGKADSTAVELSAVEAGTGGFVINGVSASDGSGVSVSGAGDVNGDGLDDLIVGAFGDDPNGASSGASFVVFGKADGTAVELSAVEAGTGGFVINGVSSGDNAGLSVSGAGDVNGDGLDDLIVGANGDDPNGSNSGASFVVFGKADGTPVELSAVEAGTGGFVINGVSASDRSGGSVSGAGDVNGDGLDDLIVGANGDDPNGSSSGASFVVFGGNVTFDVDVSGTSGADTLTGDITDEIIYGAAGNDTINGGGGLDRLSGGQGADTFVGNSAAGTATVVDFDASEGDVLDLRDFRFSNFSGVQATMTGLDYQGNAVSGSDLPVKATLIDLGRGSSIILMGVKPDDISESQVLFSTFPPG